MFSAMLVLFGAREAGCLERWLPYRRWQHSTWGSKGVASQELL